MQVLRRSLPDEAEDHHRCGKNTEESHELCDLRRSDETCELDRNVVVAPARKHEAHDEAGEVRRTRGRGPG